MDHDAADEPAFDPLPRTQSTPDQPPAVVPDSERIVLRDRGSLLAALPAMFGFVPERSLILLMVGDPVYGDLGPSARMDLPAGGPTGFADLGNATFGLYGDTLTLLDQAIHCCRRIAEQVPLAGVYIVVVDDRMDPLRPPSGTLDLLTSLRHELEFLGYAIYGELLCDALAAGARWMDLSELGDGTVPDPACGPLAADRTLRGERTYGSRGEMAVRLRHAPDLDADEFTRAVRRRMRGRRARARTPHRLTVECTRTLLRLVRRVAAGHRPSAQDVVEAAAALRDPVARDHMLALAASDLREPADELWAELTRRCHGTDRATGATLFAFDRFTAGEGAPAWVAVDIALEDDPGDPLAGLLRRSLETAAAPELFREIAASAWETLRHVAFYGEPELVRGRAA